MSQNDIEPKVCVWQEKKKQSMYLQEMQSMHANSIESTGSYKKQTFLIEVASFPQNTGPGRHRYRKNMDGPSIHFWPGIKPGSTFL